jgi:hypothetical protein
MAAKYLKTGYPPAKKAVMYLVSAGILERGDTRKRNKKNIAKEIIDVFSKSARRPKKPGAYTAT